MEYFSPVIATQDSSQTSSGVLRGGPLVAGVEVSVRYTESHTLSATVSQQTLESGAKVSDHVILDPTKVDIDFEVTNVGDGPSVAKDVFETFKKMLQEREPVELITEHFIYEQMVLVNLSPVHEAPFKGRLRISATLEEVKFVKIEVVGREPRVLAGKKSGTSGTKSQKDTTKKTASAPVNAGTVEAKPVKNQSVLDRMLFGKSN